MATSKTKTKSKAKSTSKSSKSKSPSKKRTTKTSAKQASQVKAETELIMLTAHSKGGSDTIVENHPFAVGTKVKLIPATEVEIENKPTRKDFSKAEKTVEVDEFGQLKAPLARGEWAGEGKNVEGDLRFVQFSVK